MHMLKRLASLVKMAIMLEECITEEQPSVVHFLWTRVFMKKCILFKVESVCCIKRFTTGSRNFLKDA
jgi:hypothetical protein